MIQDWKFFAKVLLLPLFFFLCFDFLYRLSEMNVARDAWLSFAFLEAAAAGLAVILALPFALALRPLGESDGTFLRRAAAVFSIWLSLLLFLFYLKKWVFSFTLADEMGKLVVKNRYLLLASIALVAFPVFLKRRRFHNAETALSGVAHRFALLAASVTVVCLLTVAITFLRGPSVAKAGIPTGASDTQKRPDVLLLVVDTLSALHLSAYDPSNGLTPNFDRWTKEGIFFRNARINVTSTGPSISSLLSGQSPFRSGVLGYHPVPGRAVEENLLTYLEASGYETASAADLDLASVAFHGWPTPTRGESFSYLPSWNDKADRWMAERARRLGFSLRFRMPVLRSLVPKPFGPAFDAIKERFENKPASQKPSFLYAHLYLPSRMSHDVGPVLTMSTYPRHYEPAEQPQIDLARGNYDKTVAAWDEALGRFLDGLKADGTLETTIVAITADHGESFSRGFWGHGDDISEDSIRVPLLILDPSHRPQTIETPVQTCDIAPTLLDLAGLPEPLWMDGISALSERPRREAVTFNYLIHTPLRTRIAFPGLASGRSIALFEDGAKFIERPEEKNELFDLAKDPKETKNLAIEDAEKAGALKQKLTALISAASKP
jgi:arylsulfatase A-like enzyme